MPLASTKGQVDERSTVLSALGELVNGVIYCELMILNRWLPEFCLPTTHRSHVGLRALKFFRKHGSAAD